MNILFTSVGNLAFPTVRRCVKNHKIIGCDIRNDAHGLYFCDKTYIVAKRSDKNYLKQINKIIKKEKINLIFPLSTEDQDYYSTHKFSVPAICSDVSNVNDKRKLYETCKNIVRVPKDVIDAPFVIKPARGKGAEGVYIVAYSAEDIKEQDRQFYMNYMTYFNTRDKYKNHIKCEYINGDEYSVDCLSYKGKFIYGVVRKRLQTWKGLAMVAQVVYMPTLLILSKKIIKHLNLSYINNIQFKMKGEKPVLLEINPRIPGTLALSIAAGGDFINDAIKLAKGKKVVKKNIRYGLKIIRYYDGVIIDAKEKINDNTI